LDLLEAGLLYPDLSESRGKLKSLEQWIGLGGVSGPAVFAHPHVTERALGEGLGLPRCPGETSATGGVREADGLEWPLRLAAVWQQVAGGPLPLMEGWNAGAGWQGRPPAGNPYPSARLLALLLLSRLPPDGWADPAEVERWVLERHPYWTNGNTNGVVARRHNEAAVGQF